MTESGCFLIPVAVAAASHLTCSRLWITRENERSREVARFLQCHDGGCKALRRSVHSSQVIPRATRTRRFRLAYAGDNRLPHSRWSCRSINSASRLIRQTWSQFEKEKKNEAPSIFACPQARGKLAELVPNGPAGGQDLYSSIGIFSSVISTPHRSSLYNGKGGSKGRVSEIL